MSRRAAARPWPITPALAATEFSRSELARRARIGNDTWALGALTDDQADRVAIAIGVHPSDLWPEWFEVLPPDPDVCGGCGGKVIEHRGRRVCRSCDRARSARRRELLSA